MREPLNVEIPRLLAADLTDAELDKALVTLAQERAAEWQQLDDHRWALQLYHRAPYIFSDFILSHYVAQSGEVLEELLRQAEASDHALFFQALYRRVASPERWNVDVLCLVKEVPDYNDIVRGVMLRQGEWAVIREDTLIALYERHPSAFQQNYTYPVQYSSQYNIFQLPSPPGNLADFRRVVAKREPDSELAGILFRRYASRDEWLAEVKRLLKERPKKIVQALEAIHPDDASADLPDDLADALRKKFGDSVNAYLRKRSLAYMRQNLQTIIRAEPDNHELYQTLQRVAYESWQQFRALTGVWATALYDRDADAFESFILWNADPRDRSIPEVLARTRRDGRYEFFRNLYAGCAQSNDWNADLLDVLRSNMSLGSIERELERLDVQRGRLRWATVYISDEAAAALYRREPDEFREFIWRYLPAGAHDFPALTRALEEAGDMDFLLRLFRKTVTSPAWNAEMQRLLEQDIPADQILEELEKRKPVNPAGVQPDILAQFMAKYGEAVLPFFENYLDWTTPARLYALFDLELDRADLLRELLAIARRQPGEFARRAHIWLPRLYDLSPEFFATFITRHLNWESSDAVRALLPRIEADGNDDLFTDLYSRFYQREDWYWDIARLLGERLSDEALHAALIRRSSSWNTLPDDLATQLYQRNPTLFRVFILEHITVQYGDAPSYDRLTAAAKQRGDEALVEAVLLNASPQSQWECQMKDLLKRDVPPDQIVAELRSSLPKQRWRLRNVGILRDFVQKYGDSVMPFLLDESLYLPFHGDRRLREMVQRHTSKANYWRFMFMTQHDDKAWNNELLSLAEQKHSEGEFRIELAYLTPDDRNPWRRRGLEGKTAVALYRRFPNATRPFIERFLDDDAPELYQLAQNNRDEDFADFLTYRMMTSINQLAYRAFPPPRWRSVPDKNAQQQIEEIGQSATARLDKLYASSPQEYVRRAARILSFVAQWELGSRGAGASAIEHNPVWHYLTARYHEDWLRSREAMTELLESPSIYVQLAALDMLSEGGSDAAARVGENLPAFRALLLSDARKRTKRQVLACLDTAALADVAVVERIAPLLQEALEFDARRAIPDDIAVAYVRLQSAG